MHDTDVGITSIVIRLLDRMPMAKDDTALPTSGARAIQLAAERMLETHTSPCLRKRLVHLVDKYCAYAEGRSVAIRWPAALLHLLWCRVLSKTLTRRTLLCALRLLAAVWGTPLETVAADATKAMASVGFKEMVASADVDEARACLRLLIHLCPRLRRPTDMPVAAFVGVLTSCVTGAVHKSLWPYRVTALTLAISACKDHKFIEGALKIAGRQAVAAAIATLTAALVPGCTVAGVVLPPGASASTDARPRHADIAAALVSLCFAARAADIDTLVASCRWIEIALGVAWVGCQARENPDAGSMHLIWTRVVDAVMKPLATRVLLPTKLCKSLDSPLGAGRAAVGFLLHSFKPTALPFAVPDDMQAWARVVCAVLGTMTPVHPGPDMVDDACMICLENMPESAGRMPVVALPVCRHQVHAQCLLQYFVTTPNACYKDECCMCKSRVLRAAVVK